MPDERALTTLKEVGNGTTLPPKMIEDLRHIADLDTTVVEGLSKAVAATPGVLTRDRLHELIKEAITDEKAAGSVARTLRNMPPEIKEEILGIVDRWRHSNKKRLELLSDSIFDALKRNIDLLVQDYPAVSLMRKAERLLRDTGNEFEEALFICDLRPIFDKPQKRVEGFVALTTFRLRYLRQSGDSDFFELTLTEDELSTLVEHAQRALNKLRVLKESIHDLVQ